MRSNKPLILFTVFISIMLVSAMTLNFRLFSRGKQYYLELNQTRLDPLGWNKYPRDSNPKTKVDSTVRFVFFGDSRAVEWVSPNRSGYEFINRGIGSQTSIQTLERFEQHITPLQPDVVLVQVGINDLKTIPLFPGQKETIIANCKANIQKIVDNSKALGALVILTPIFPIGSIPLERQPFWSEDVSLAIEEVNTYLNSFASENVIILDSSSILANEKGVMQRQYSKDELHLNPEGYKVLNQALVELLNSLEPIMIKR